MDIKDMTDDQILQRLLDADTVPEKTVTIPRLGVPVTLKGLTGKQVFNLREQCTHRYKERGRDVQRLDEEAFNCGLIALATVKPNWGDQQLMTKFNASGPEEVIKRILLAGELAMLGDEVMDLSGFNLEAEEIKNG
ncbi:MAG: hypothetical protein ABFD18_06235 [Syntrophomonas sp.]